MGLAARYSCVLLASTALVIATNLSGPAQAQTAEEDDGATILQRIVFGFGEARVATDTPQAVSVIQDDDIDQEQAALLGEIFDGVPNTQFIGGNRVLGQTINIRGIGQGESASDEGRIIVNVDGVPQFFEQYRMGGIFLDPELFRRVEVLRGPAASTLYGAGALGGVVNFETKDASDFLTDDDRFFIRLGTQYDSNPNGFLGSAIVAASLGEQAEVLLAGNYRRAQEYSDGNGDDVPGSDFETPSGLAKATVFFDDLREQQVSLSYLRFSSDEDDSDYNQLQGGDGFGTVDRTVVNQQLQLAYENDDADNPWIDLRVSVAWNLISNEQTEASDAPPGGGTSLFQDSNYEYETFNALAQNTFAWTGDTFENFLTVGTQITHQSRRTGTTNPLGFHPEGTDFQVGFFAQSEFVWNDRLTIIPGVRVDFQELSADSGVLGADLRAPDDVSEVAFSPKIAAMYEFNDHLSIFGSFARTERFPTLDEIYSSDFPSRSAPTAPPNYSLDLGKETSNNFEAGFVLSGFDLFVDGDALDFKTTAFYNRVDDLIERQRREYPQYVNVDEAVIYGVEVEAAYSSDTVFASLGFGYTYGNNETDNEPLDTVAPPELTAGLGYRLPQHGLTFGWEGRFVLAENRVPISQPNPRFFSPEQIAEILAEEELKRDSFHTHDLYASWEPDETSAFHGWEANFRVENIFDVQYQDYLANDPGMGRTFRISLARSLGI